MNVTYFNDGIHNTVSNVTYDLFVDVYGFVLNFVLKTPETSTDKNYGRVYLRTSINAERFLSGNRGNFLTGLLFGQLLRALDFEVKFPLLKVNTLISFK